MRTVSLALFGLATALVSSVGIGTAAPVPKHLMKDAPQPAGLEGKWKLETMKRGAKAFPVQAGSMTLEFGDGVLTTVMSPDTKDAVVDKAILIHDPPRKQFRAIQHKDAQGRIVNPDVGYGYAIDGDKLTLATIQGVNLGFTPADPLKPGPSDVVIVLVRVK